METLSLGWGVAQCMQAGHLQETNHPQLRIPKPPSRVAKSRHRCGAPDSDKDSSPLPSPGTVWSLHPIIPPNRMLPEGRALGTDTDIRLQVRAGPCTHVCSTQNLQSLGSWSGTGVMAAQQCEYPGCHITAQVKNGHGSAFHVRCISVSSVQSLSHVRLFATP